MLRSRQPRRSAATAVQKDMADGYVLTDYFYYAFAAFEKQPQSFKESIGEMVYGMDVSQQLSHVKNTTFNQQSYSDVVHRSPRELERAGPGGNEIDEG